MRPKILHVTASQLSSGGVERHILGLCQSLRDDFKFALLSGADDLFSKQLREASCFTYPWSVRRAFDISAARTFSAAVQLYRPEIVHIHDARANLLSHLWPWGAEVKTIRTVHLSSLQYRWGRFDRTRRFLHAGMERFFYTFFTDMVIYPSRRGWRDALRYHYVPENKAVCIPNGIDLKPFESVQPKTIQKNGPVICTVARLSPEKNVALLLEAASILGQRGRDFQLWVVGEGPERTGLEALSERLGLSSRTRFWGRQEDVASILFQADIFALTSWYEGGRAQAVMEAQAAGLPCVMSDVGDNASMADGGAGLIFPEGDASACADRLERLLADPQLRLEMGTTARRNAFQVYNLQVVADQYRQVYRSLLEK
jgi:glycosyltransferase involved in cell wall biosynthesis